MWKGITKSLSHNKTRNSTVIREKLNSYHPVHDTVRKASKRGKAEKKLYYQHNRINC